MPVYYQLTPFVPYFPGSSGAPLSNGTLNIYLAGTTTPSTLYTDDVGTATGAVITLNTRGYPSISGNTVLLYALAGVEYKIVLKDRTGAIIYTIDDISIDSGLRTDLAAPTGTDLVTYGIRTLTARLQETVSAKDFLHLGPITTAIQAAITFAETYIPVVNVYVPQAPCVVIPDGINELTDSLYITKPIRLKGSGKQSTKLIQTAANKPAIKVTQASGAPYCKYIISDIGIQGTKTYNSVATQDAQHGIWVDAAVDITIEITNVRIGLVTGNGILFGNALNSPLVANCEIQQCALNGIFFNGNYATNVNISQNIIRENLRGIYVNSATGANIGTGRIFDNLIESNNKGTGTVGSATRPNQGIAIYNGAYWTIDGNYCEANGNDIYLNNSDWCVVTRNKVGFANTYNLPGLFGGPPARRLSPIYADNATGNTVITLNQIINRPNKPGATSDADWGTSSFGATYEHIYQSSDSGCLVMNNIATGVGGTATDVYGDYFSVGPGKFKFQCLPGYAPEYITKLNGNTSGFIGYHRVQTLAGTNQTYLEFNYKGILIQTMALGDVSYTIDYGSAAPTTGTYTRGSRRYASTPSAGGFVGWVCVSGGTPGTWKGFGAIEA